MSNPPRTLKDALTALKTRTGLSYSQMEQQAGLDQKAAWHLAQCDYNIREAITRLAEAFNENPEEWLHLAGLAPLPESRAEDSPSP